MFLKTALMNSEDLKREYFFFHALPFENLYLLWQKDDAKNKLQHTHWSQDLYKSPIWIYSGKNVKIFSNFENAIKSLKKFDKPTSKKKFKKTLERLWPHCATVPFFVKVFVVSMYRVEARITSCVGGRNGITINNGSK